MSRDDVRTNLRSWEADSADYQARNAEQLDRWDRLAWGIWDVPEDEVNALGDVEGLEALELGCGACQFGIRVAKRGARVTGLDFSANQLRAGLQKMEASGVRLPLVRARCGAPAVRGCQLRPRLLRSRSHELHRPERRDPRGVPGPATRRAARVQHRLPVHLDVLG